MLLEKVRRYIRAHDLLREGDRVLVAVSGGPDSLCLLHLLRALAPGLKLQLVVGHLNHGLRPEAAGEAEAVRTLAAKWSLPFAGGFADVPSLKASRKLSVEEAARLARYEFLREAAVKHGAAKIAVGHQRDDQAETVLLNLLRGTGPDGLAGILPRRPLGSVELIRPLLCASRREIEAYCRRHGLLPILDPSNLQTDYTRNKIRLELIPHLEQVYNPRLKEALARLASLAAADSRYLAAQAARAFRATVRASEGRVVLNCASFNRLPAALRGRVVCLALAKVIPRQKISFQWVRQIMELAAAAGPAREVALPGGARVYRSYGKLVLTAAPPAVPQPPEAPVPLQIPGQTPLPDGKVIEASFRDPAELDWPPPPTRAYLDYHRLPGPPAVRKRRPGDRFHPQGAPGKKKLKDFLIDGKIPRHRRDALPLVVAGDEIVWVAGLRIAHPYRVTAATRMVLVLELLPAGQEGDLG